MIAEAATYCGQRCYACRQGSAVEGAPAGLCADCRRRSLAVREVIHRLHPARFSPEHFLDELVDPPAWRPGERCARCGVVGQCHGWNEWSFRDAEDGARVAEGDGYLFCENCASLMERPWSEAVEVYVPTPLNYSAVPAPQAEVQSRTVVLMEVLLLFALSVAILVMLI